MPGIDGIISGLDTTSIVDAIIEFERQPAVLMENEVSEKQAIISAFQSLQAKFIGLNSSLLELSKSSSFEKSAINVSDEDVLEVTADGRVSTAIYDMQVLALARNHQIASQGISSDDASSFGTGTLSINVGDGSSVTIEITEDNNTLTQIKDAINDSDANVTASIINDGSSSNPYRLIISAKETGADNEIEIVSNLEGGSTSLNFDGSSFDIPETVKMASTSTSAVSLGTTASYTGSSNKTYTFTVDSSGEQTIGSDNITLNWTDGTNSGSIIVTQADTEVELIGDGADGLTIQLSSGILNEGDSFQVQSFAPLLQEAADAKISFGSNGGVGSPITVTSATNEFNNVIDNLDIKVKQLTNIDETVTVTTDIDVAGIKEKIEAFIRNFNDVVEYIDEQNKYTEDSTSTPALFGEYSVWSLTNNLRRNIGSRIDSIDGEFKQLVSIGIQTQQDGTLTIKDAAALEDALRDNLDDVIKLFSTSGDSTSSGVEFVSATSETNDNFQHTVNITQAATKGGFRGSQIADPASNQIIIDSTNKNLKLKVDGLVSDNIALTEGTYNSYTDLIAEIQNKIDNDDKVGARGVTVEWVDNGDGTGYIEMKSNTYGSSSKVEVDKSVANGAYSIIGFANGQYYKGQNVEGTINGFAATGAGQFLTGDDDNPNSAGLKLKVTLTNADIIYGDEAVINVVKGIATTEYEYVDSLTSSSDGVFDKRVQAYQKQIDLLTNQIEDFDERLKSRRESLFEQYSNMESALSELNSIGDYLTSQLSQIQANWKNLNND